MKALIAVLLAASLAANAFLARDVFVASHTAETAKRPASSSTPAALVSDELWAQLREGNPAAVERLRALGLPENFVRALVRAEIDAQFRPRERALASEASAKQNYWERSFQMYGNYSQQMELHREKTGLLKKLLGDAAASSENNYYDTRYAFLPAEKRERLRSIEEDYNVMRASLTKDANTTVGFALNQDQLTLLEKERRADIVASLTPQELEEYDVRNSPVSHTLRSRLQGFDPTEEEFRAIFKLHQAAAPDDVQRFGMLSPEESDARQKTQAVVDAEVKKLLGDARYADYERAKDSEYRMLRNLTDRLALPPAKAAEAHTLKNSLEKKLREIRPPANLPQTERQKFNTEARAALLREAETGFTQLLGEKGYEAYREYSYFFQRLDPPRPPPTQPKR